jgi:crossover junction endodeoxyribonuclease RusA
MTEIVLDVVGIPAPQGSKTGYYNPKIGRVMMVEGKAGQRDRHKTWREGVAQACRDHVRENPMSVLDEPIAVNVLFRFALPKSDQYRTMHTGAPDIDKLLRSTFDALKLGGLIRDDSIIASVFSNKTYAHGDSSPGATITIMLMGEIETERRDVLKAQAKAARKGSA